MPPPRGDSEHRERFPAGFRKTGLHCGETGLHCVPAWTLWLLRGQLAIPYVYGGLAKLNGDWLHGQPLTMWMSRMDHVRGVIPIWGDARLALAFSWGGLLLDLCVVPLLLWRPARRWAFLAATAFHLLNAVMFSIGVFPWLMICATTLFLDPAWPRHVVGRFFKPSEITEGTDDLKNRPTISRVNGALVAAWFAVQLLVPLRHWFHPGNVDWTEEGSRFAWRMMLCDKWSALRFVVTDPVTGRKSGLDPRPYLDERQFDKMSQDPDLLLEFCHFLARELEQAGRPGMEIRAVVLCSLNGRKPQHLIDPAIDLAKMPRTLAHKPWIVPLDEPRRAEPWDVPPTEWERMIKSP